VLSIGSVIDERYQILGLLAEGGLGPVFRALRVPRGDDVALKVLLAPDRPAFRERFMRALSVAAGLRHPHVVGIVDFGTDAAGRFYLVMELLNGRSLRDELDAGGPLDPDKALSIARPLCAALQMAHDRGIAHRDLKPSNVVSHRAHPGHTVYKIIDFGLADVRDAAEETRLAAARRFVGTIAYASPEQLGAQTANALSDVYSLGVVIFEMLTGRVPFEGDVSAIVAGHLTASPPRVTSLRPDLPEWLDPVVSRALAKRPHERWPSMTALAHALEDPA